METLTLYELSIVSWHVFTIFLFVSAWTLCIYIAMDNPEFAIDGLSDNWY